MGIISKKIIWRRYFLILLKNTLDSAYHLVLEKQILRSSWDKLGGTVDGSEILHQLRLVVGSLCHYLRGFLHPRWLAGFLPSTVCLPILLSSVNHSLVEAEMKKARNELTEVVKTASRFFEGQAGWCGWKQCEFKVSVRSWVNHLRFA